LASLTKEIILPLDDAGGEQATNVPAKLGELQPEFSTVAANAHGANEVTAVPLAREALGLPSRRSTGGFFLGASMERSGQKPLALAPV
jgi:hypothetical protein